MDFMLPETDWVPPTELPDLRNRKRITLDLETRDDGLSNNIGPGWAYGTGHISGIAVVAEGVQVYIPIAHPDTECFDKNRVKEWVADHFKIDSQFCFHNSGYDLGWILADLGVSPPRNIDDTKIMDYLLDENALNYQLDTVAKRRGVPGKDEGLLRQAAEALGCDPKKDMWRMPARFVGPYAVQDAAATQQLVEVMWPQLETQSLEDAYRLETALVPMLLEMRRRGIRIDMDAVGPAKRQLLGKRDEALAELSDKLTIGRDVTITDVLSSKFLLGLFTAENLPYGSTEKGNPSFANDEIDKIDHWLPQLVVTARQAHDAGNKFIGNYISSFCHRGRLHAEANATKTRTTRFAYSSPPLQQMPSRNPDVASLIRGLFLPEQGEVWGALDYSQQEFRLMVHYAHLCGIKGVDFAVAKYHNDPTTDFHDLAAEMTKLPRRKAKDVNFAKAFGAGRDKFALMTGMTKEDAVATMEQYDEELPFIKGLSEFCQNRANSKGYIRLLDGARSHFDRWEPRWTEWSDVQEARKKGLNPNLSPCSRDLALERVSDPDHPWKGRLRRGMTHKAMNSLIQGSAARQTKMCMLACWNEGIVPLLQMHDELDFSFSNKRDALRAEEIMRDTVPLEVPVVVDAEFGSNWGNAKATGEYDASFEAAMKRIGK